MELAGIRLGTHNYRPPDESLGSQIWTEDKHSRRVCEEDSFAFGMNFDVIRRVKLSAKVVI